jgi:hypothetical protein
LTIDQLAGEVDRLGDGLLFRGETGHNEFMKASAFRPGKEGLQAASFFEHAAGQISAALDGIAGGNHREYGDIVYSVLLQHYDHISPGLDLTSDWRTAAWFASHRFVQAPPAVFHVDSHRLRTNRTAIESREDCTGFIYAFRRECLKRYGLVDVAAMLDKLPGDTSQTRPVKQEAWLAGYGPAGREHDFKRDIEAVFEFTCTGRDFPDVTLRDLYPACDPILHGLLNSTFSLMDEDDHLERWVAPIEFEDDFDYTEAVLRTLVPVAGMVERKADVLWHSDVE